MQPNYMKLTLNQMNKNKYTYVFFGSDEFSILVLTELIKKGFVPTYCITQPDKPKGRKLILTPTPLKEFCLTQNIEVKSPEQLSKIVFNDQKQFDFFVVASYGKIISQSILDIPIHGCLNVHPSLLPLYRGASPIETTLRDNNLSTGVTIIKMDAQMDHGPILAQTKYTFKSWPNTKKEVHDTLATIGGKLLVQTIESYIEDAITATEQDHTQATFTKMIQKNDGEIFLDALTYDTYLAYLAYTPWPGLFFYILKGTQKIRIKVDTAHYDSVQGFVIDTVIPEGKNSMNFASFKNGYLL